MTLFESICGRRPFTGTTLQELLTERVYGPDHPSFAEDLINVGVAYESA